MNKKAIKIAFFDTKKYDIETFEKENQSYGFQIDFFESRLKESSVKLTKGYDVVCIFVRDRVNEAVIDQLVANGVKMIALRCAGFNNVDIKAAEGRIPVVRVPAYSPYAVAEHAVALMLGLNRKIHKAYNRTREGNFTLDGLTGFDMHGKTVGIIGTGKIAKVLIHILKGFGMQVVAYDPYPDSQAASTLGYRYVTLDELYRESDIISLHCPLTDQTNYIINDESIQKMKDGVMIINTGRGKLVETQSLIEGLKSGKISAAGIDVYEEENAWFFKDHSTQIIDDDVLSRLMMMPNVIVTSHQAFLTKEALENIAKTTLENIKELQENKALTNKVN